MASLPRRLNAPAVMNLRKSTLAIVAGVLLLLSLGVTYLVTSWKTAPAAPPLPEVAPTTTASMDTILKELPKDYGQAKAAPILPPKGIPLPSISLPQPSIAHAAVPPAPDPRPPAPLPLMPIPSAPIQQQAPAVPTPPIAPPPIPERGQNAADSKKWLVAQPVDIRFKRQAAAQTTAKPTEETQVAQAQTLIPSANWVKPRRPELVLYRDMYIPVILKTALNSDIPGPVGVMVTRDVLDRFQSGTILVPQFSSIVGKQEGKTQYGQGRLDVTLDQIITPEGTVIKLSSPKLGDASGAIGLPGNVNNHIPKLLLGVGLSAILNIGVRSATGTPGTGQFYQNPAQQAAQDVGQSVQRDASSIIDRQLKVPPTITANPGDEGTIQLLENISFQNGPKRTDK